MADVAGTKHKEAKDTVAIAAANAAAEIQFLKLQNIFMSFIWLQSIRWNQRLALWQAMELHQQW
jgi:hypothetical protein